jgi:hypothetical protein
MQLFNIDIKMLGKTHTDHVFLADVTKGEYLFSKNDFNYITDTRNV